ncbi:MAG: hypothetical protein JWP44_3235 [Mucilaginibacter sp.]|nr:hypothetical protein [Mucilaginibacter sp.]
MPVISLKLNRNIYFITAVAFAIFIGGTVIMHIVPLTARNKIANALLADFTITFPVLYYLIIIRPLRKSARSVLLVISLCCFVAYLILPQHQKDYILQARKLTTLAELGFIIYAFTKFKKINRSYKVHQSIMADPIYNLRSAMADILGESLAIKVLAAELAVLRYGLLFLKKEKAILKESVDFSTYKEAGYIPVWCIIIVSITVELVAVHLLLMKWSSLAAVIVTILSIYGSVIIVADLSAIVKRNLLINKHQLVLRTGLRWRTITTPENVHSIRKIVYDHPAQDGLFMGGVLKKNGNLLILFREPVLVDKLYGSGKRYTSILMNIDDFEAFAAHLKQ